MPLAAAHALLSASNGCAPGILKTNGLRAIVAPGFTDNQFRDLGRNG